MARNETPKTCTRCGGTGSIPGFSYIDGGRCWGCLGAGTLEAQKAAKPFLPVKSVRVRQDRRPSQGGPIDITIWERGGIYKVTVSDADTATAEVFATLDEARTAANAAFRTHQEA